ncbi:MAG: plastocyanin/azurin family copper-binding protein [Ktedonobacterales bacterium]
MFSTARSFRRLTVVATTGILGLTLVLAACGGSTASGTSSTGTNPPTATTGAPTATAPAATATTGGGAKAAVAIGGVSTYAFSPSSISVKTGTTVTWTNNTQAPHTVTSDGGPASFNGSLDSNGSTFSFTFTQAGTYTYHCSVHPYMKATIVVTA